MSGAGDDRVAESGWGKRVLPSAGAGLITPKAPHGSLMRDSELGGDGSTPGTR